MPQEVTDRGLSEVHMLPTGTDDSETAERLGTIGARTLVREDGEPLWVGRGRTKGSEAWAAVRRCAFVH
ncbi:hypothetical protein VFPBJ_11303 [Purpureocillium lilacinum]|uniref:Uncharacterized protein n=1 Tax=Purpureocillium lilacinum TaxID=33203 RepID=A0A179FEB8_PURLI|nr:hypothetical protein VFPBJ_11303 [Purpureocillium lilacinum]